MTTTSTKPPHGEVSTEPSFLQRALNPFARVPGITLVFYFVWKITLLLFTNQPIPVSDSFFYDGAVVNYLLHGHYCNPAIAAMLPISGQEIFSAYPPLHQAILLGWMKCFGPSVLSAMWMHVTVLAVIAMISLQILRTLNVPALAINFAGLFFFGITFHDRPDTVAHMFGLLTILVGLRNLTWAAAAFLLLTFCTSLQIAGFYTLWLSAFLLSEGWLAKRRIPWAAILAFVATSISLVLIVRFGFPRCWTGFQEHLAVTSALTGWRVPSVSDFNKIIRNLPAVLLVMGGLLLMSRYSEAFRQQARTSRPLRLIGSGCLAALCLMAGSMFVLTPFTVFNIFYQQPVLVGGFLAILAATGWPGLKGQRLLYGLFFLALLQVSIRAIGISTWGVWCARDVSYTQATTRINQELDTLSAGEIIFASGAHLYGIANRTNITWLHANWPLPTNLANWQITALEHHHPAKLILTPIDYYMTYEPALRQMQQTRSDVQIRIITLTKIPPPEATPLTGKLLQYLSWAPIIVDISWPERPVKELHTQ